MTQLLRIFANKCLHRNIPVFVIDPTVLRHLVSDVESDRRCPLCSVGDVISLGVFGPDWEKRGSLLRDLSDDEDVVIHKVTSPDPRSLSLERLNVPSIPTHYFIRQSGNIPLHLVVFYDRGNEYWWHSSIGKQTATTSQGLQGLNIVFGNSAGAYGRFEVRPTMVEGVFIHLPHPVEEFLVQMRKAVFIECDYHRAQQFLRANPPTSSHITRNGAKVLLLAKSLLDHLGVRFRIGAGTILGWYRQCGIIPYTNDIDIEIPIQDYSPSILPAFFKAGFKLSRAEGKLSDGYHVLFHIHAVLLDMLFIYEEKTHVWVGSIDQQTGDKFRFVLPKSDTCWTEFMGFRVRIPCPTLPYITTSYGDNWNTPVQEWNWTLSGSNIYKNGMWPKQ
ncbi:ribitol-5-phosphate transferase FKTN-like [Haliotis asinina]|uniref:ribitol-5-phosphate transferase FKTN-like n=1 Tax=Haliotis asinina TaxID=109174 RepID=UPI0035320D0F